MLIGALGGFLFAIYIYVFTNVLIKMIKSTTLNQGLVILSIYLVVIFGASYLVALFDTVYQCQTLGYMLFQLVTGFYQITLLVASVLGVLALAFGIVFALLMGVEHVLSTYVGPWLNTRQPSSPFWTKYKNTISVIAFLILMTLGGAWLGTIQGPDCETPKPVIQTQ